MGTTTPFCPRPTPRHIHTADTLTGREKQIVGLVAEAATNRSIADTLSISEETVKRHITNILDKTGLSSRAELIVQHLHRQFEARLQHLQMAA